MYIPPSHTRSLSLSHAHTHTHTHPQCLERAFFLHEKGVGEEIHYQYLQLAQSLEEFIGKTFNEWVATVDKELRRHLEQPLMARSTARGRYVHWVSSYWDEVAYMRLTLDLLTNPLPTRMCHSFSISQWKQKPCSIMYSA